MEKDLAVGKISKKEYDTGKKLYNQKLENLEVAERIRRLQGRDKPEKSLDQWVEKSKKDKKQLEEGKLLERYVTDFKSSKPQKKIFRISKTKLGLLTAVFFVIAFFVGSGFGIYLLGFPTTANDGPVLVNDTAFPTFQNMANLNQNIVETGTNPAPIDTESPGGNVDTGGNDDNGGDTGGGGNNTG